MNKYLLIFMTFCLLKCGILVVVIILVLTVDIPE